MRRFWGTGSIWGSERRSKETKNKWMEWERR